MRGHVLVGTDAAEVTGADPALVRQLDGQRWHRCLRCDDWTPMDPPAAPARASVPGRDEIELPLRGPLLRDRYVLRLIALDRAVHVVVLSGLAVAIFLFLGNRAALQHDYVRIMNDLSGSSGGPAAVRGLLGVLRRLTVVSSRHLYEIGLLVTAYALLEACEMVGLWLAQRWAEYLTFVATLVFVPLEIYELSRGPSVLKVITFALNIAIALYLLLAKRLFGVRGGHRAEHERRHRLSGWGALDAATPALSPAGTASAAGTAPDAGPTNDPGTAPATLDTGTAADADLPASADAG
jgi:uncharacterized membrane protein (DUF2068 family)